MKKTLCVISLVYSFLAFGIEENSMSLQDFINHFESTFIYKEPSYSYKIQGKSDYYGSYTNNIETHLISGYYIGKDEQVDVKIKDINKNNDEVDVLRGFIKDNEVFHYNSLNEPFKFIFVDSRESTLKNKIGTFLFFDDLSLCVYGRFYGDRKSLSDILKEEKNVDYSITNDVLDGKGVIYGQIKTEYGTYKLWLDPEKGYCPRKIIIEKKVGDRTFWNKIGDSRGPRPEGLVQTALWESLTSSVITAYPITIKEVNGHFFPVEINIVRRNEYESGIYSVLRQKIVKFDVTLKPDYEKLGAFKYAHGEVPDGTGVIFEDKRGMSGVEYEWFNGEIKTKIDKAFLDELDKTVESDKAEKTSAVELAKIESVKSETPKTTNLPKEDSNVKLIISIVIASIALLVTIFGIIKLYPRKKL